MGKFERDLDEALLRYGRRREKIEQLYEKEREASLQNQELEPREESIGKVQWASLVIGFMVIVGVGLSLWPEAHGAWQSFVTDVEEDSNMTRVTKSAMTLIPMAFALIVIFGVVGAVFRSVRAEEDETDGEAEYCDWEGGPYECQKDATVLMEGRKFDLGLCVRHAEELDRMAPGDYRRSKL